VRGIRARRVLSGLLALAIVLLVVELTARLAVTLLNDLDRLGGREPDWFRYSAELGWESRPGFRGEVYGAERAFDERGFLAVDTQQVEAEDGVKVVFLGDSNAFGHGIATGQTFPEVVEELMPGVSAINLALPGYTSFQGLRILQTRGISIGADVVVICFSYNDRRYVVDASEVDSDVKFRSTERKVRRQRTERRVESLYLYRLLRKLAGAAGLRTLDRSPAAKDVPWEQLQPRVPLDAYGRNLSRMAEIARDNGSAVIFLNLSDHPVQTGHVRAGLARLEEGRPDLAIEPLEIAVSLQNAFSDLARHRLWRAYRQAGQEDRAMEHARLAKPFLSLHGGDPFHLDSEYAEAMRAVADQMHAEYVDAAPILMAHPADFRDINHFNEAAHRRVAELLAERIVELLPDSGQAAGVGISKRRLGAVRTPSADLLPAVEGAPESGRSMAITFDDLPAAALANGGNCNKEALIRFTQRLLARITAHQIPAVGLVTEGNICDALREDVLPEVLGMWLHAGLELGNHTFSHPDLNHTSVRAYQEDILRGEAITRPLLDERGMALRYFRYPLLHTGDDTESKEQIERFLADRGYTIAPVTIDSQEWLFAAVYARAKKKGDEETARRVAESYVPFMEEVIAFFERRSREVLGYEPPQVLLLHANELNAARLDELVAMLRRRGYALVPLGDALKDEAYRLPDRYVGSRGLSWIHRWGLAMGEEVVEEPREPGWLADLYDSP
jgi:peptidoglycan/xylan/chitin deacetylase (PgdA/CDA1 family)/lysophospholipase L1-like esterase